MHLGRNGFQLLSKEKAKLAGTLVAFTWGLRDRDPENRSGWLPNHAPLIADKVWGFYSQTAGS